jgi:hypothetical protein
MATAKWATPTTTAGNIAGTTLDSLANGSTSAFVTHDNSTSLDLYANVRVTLGSLTPTTGGSITLRVFSTAGGAAPDNTGSVGGGDAYTVPLTVSTSAKEASFPMVRLYPESCRLCITNNAGVSLAASGNALYVRPFDETVA